MRRAGVLRGAARAEADRRPHVRGRNRADELLGSDTAEFGGYLSGPRVIDAATKDG